MRRRNTMTRRARLAAERGIAPGPSASAPLSVALLYPNNYHVGMSSLGYQLTYRTINDLGVARAERFFTDSLAEGSIETGSPLSRFDVIAVSASFELDMPNLLEMFEGAGLPVAAAERGRGGRWPLVVMGGVLIAVNRLPLYPFVDVFLHGESEVVLGPVLEALAGIGRRGKADHRARLEAIEPLAGVEITAGARVGAGLHLDAEMEALAEVPEATEAAEALPRPPAVPGPILNELDNALCETQILSPHTEFADMGLIDLARGCPHHCTFCWIGHNTARYRARSIETVLEAVERLSPLTERFGLVSSAVGAHPRIDEICRWLTGRGLKVSYSSLRVEEVTPTMLETLAAGGQKTITIAPEAGSTRVRRLLGKRIGDEEILEVVQRAVSLGMENIKLYYMLGIPSESEAEAMEIAAFTRRVRHAMLGVGKSRGKMGSVAVNLGIFVPKPNLPLNHIEPLAPGIVKRRLRRVVRELGRIPNCRVNVSSPDLAMAQSILSTGGVETSAYLKLVRRLGGDWRAANREWAPQSEAQLERRRRMSRLTAETLTLRGHARGPS